MKEDTPNIGAICQRLAKHAPSGLSVEQIVYRLGRPYNTLMSELSPLRDTHKFDVNLLIPLMRLAGSTEPLHEMARALGGVYVDFLPVSDAAHPVHGQCMASPARKEGNSPGSATVPWATFWPCCSRSTRRRPEIGAGRKRTPPELREQRRGQTSSEDCSNG